MKTQWIHKAVWFGTFILGFGLAQASEPGKGLGDGNDGNRSNPVHRITLYDEEGEPIKASDEKPRPVSMRRTCGDCHNYDLIASGWHFHSGQTNAPGGRIGEPWVLYHSKTRTQIPFSNRPWDGTYGPGYLKMSSWGFLKEFSSHFPGGNYGEMPPADDDLEAPPEEILRWPISGVYEIDCLACHHADARQDQSEAALQAARQNYRWAATAASGLGVVKGLALELDDFYDPTMEYKIRTVYDSSRFDDNNKVFLDIVRQPPANRCYFCHSVQDMEKAGDKEWTRDEDIHMTAGMTCADCHRNGGDHMITRGTEVASSDGGEGEVSTLSCRGCHMGDQEADNLAAQRSGRLGAPYPEHKGIPVIHFEVLSCTACHSGAMPKDKAGLVRTARVHKLGLHGKHAVDMKLPHLYSPVFVKGEDNKIAPHRLFWPAYWGRMEGDTVTPLNPGLVEELAIDELIPDEANDERVNDWRPLSLEQIAAVLKLIAEDQEESSKAEPVYVAGGKLDHTLEDGKAVGAPHEAADYYSWPLAHDVRPAAQSLGAEGHCGDCHETDAPFFFGSVGVDSPVAGGEGESGAKEMVEFQGVDRAYVWAFNASFVFRPWMKLVVLGACAVLGLVLLYGLLQVVGHLAKGAAGKEEE